MPMRYPDWWVQEFLARVLPPDVPGGCALWTGGQNADGYGVVSFQGETLYAHRVAMEIVLGRPPRGLVRHLCGNRLCCEAGAHLAEGTDADNYEDTVAMGRASPPPHPRGEDHPMAKLSDLDVQEIRRRYAAGETQQSIAVSKGVTQAAVSQLVNRRRRP